MTERKPPGVSFETWVERQITSAAAAGEFDDLAGAGAPIPDIDRPRDELWWVRDKLRREGVDHLPPALAIRRTHDRALRAAAAATTEADVRAILEPVDQQIRHLNSHATSGPPTSLPPIDIDEFVQRWRTAQPTPPTPPTKRLSIERGDGAEDDGAAVGERSRRARRWWQRWR